MKKKGEAPTKAKKQSVKNSASSSPGHLAQRNEFAQSVRCARKQRILKDTKKLLELCLREMSKKEVLSLVDEAEKSVDHRSKKINAQYEALYKFETQKAEKAEKAAE